MLSNEHYNTISSINWYLKLQQKSAITFVNTISMTRPFASPTVSVLSFSARVTGLIPRIPAYFDKFGPFPPTNVPVKCYCYKQEKNIRDNITSACYWMLLVICLNWENTIKLQPQYVFENKYY